MFLLPEGRQVLPYTRMDEWSQADDYVEISTRICSQYLAYTFLSLSETKRAWCLAKAGPAGVAWPFDYKTVGR